MYLSLLGNLSLWRVTQTRVAEAKADSMKQEDEPRGHHCINMYFFKFVYVYRSGYLLTEKRELQVDDKIFNDIKELVTHLNHILKEVLKA